MSTWEQTLVDEPDTQGRHYKYLCIYSTDMAMRQGAYEWRATACLAGPTTAPQPPACMTASCPFDSLAVATRWAQQRNYHQYATPLQPHLFTSKSYFSTQLLSFSVPSLFQTLLPVPVLARFRIPFRFRLLSSPLLSLRSFLSPVSNNSESVGLRVAGYRLPGPTAHTVLSPNFPPQQYNCNITTVSRWALEWRVTACPAPPLT